MQKTISLFLLAICLGVNILSASHLIEEDELRLKRTSKIREIEGKQNYAPFPLKTGFNLMLAQKLEENGARKKLLAKALAHEAQQIYDSHILLHNFRHYFIVPKWLLKKLPHEVASNLININLTKEEEASLTPRRNTSEVFKSIDFLLKTLDIDLNHPTVKR